MHSTLPRYQISVYEVGEKKISSNDIMIFYVVSGTCRYTYTENGLTKEANRRDLFLINHEEEIKLQIPPKSIVACLSIDYFALCGSMNELKLIFHLDTNSETGIRDDELRKNMQEMILSYMDRTIDNPYPALEAYCSLLANLFDQHQVTSTHANDDAITRILNYIYSNLSEELTLSALSERFYLSPSTISRTFLKHTGVHLKEFITNLRLEAVADELRTTDKNIGRIATDNGFMSPSTLNREFAAKYQISPSEYRKTNQEISTQEDDLEVNDEITDFLRMDLSQSLPPSNEIEMEADVRAASRSKRWENTLLNVGNIYSLTTATMQEQVLSLIDSLSPKYVRVWNIFDPRLMLFSSSDDDMNFAIMDEILDFCVDHKIQLFIELSPRELVTRASEKAVVHGAKEFTTFESENKWLNALTHFLKHISRRYGLDVVNRWIFEFSFFVSDAPYYVSPRYSSTRVWDLGYTTIRQIVPDAKIAGPGIIGMEDTELISMLISRFFSNDKLPDIFTAMAFPYEAPMLHGFNNITIDQSYQRITDPDTIAKQVACINEALHTKGFQGEFYVTDWGYSIANRNYLQDSCFRASYVLKNIIKLYDKVDALGIFYASDQLDVFTDSRSILSGSGGILSRNGLRKPIYYVYDVLSYMGRFRIARDEHMIITADTTSMINILCHNTSMPGSQYYLTTEDSFRPRDIEKLFTDDGDLQISIRLTVDTGDNHWKFHQLTLNSETGSVLTKWANFDYATNLQRAAVDYIRNSAIPELRSGSLQVVDGCLNLKFTMKPNEIRSITLTVD